MKKDIINNYLRINKKYISLKNEILRLIQNNRYELDINRPDLQENILYSDYTYFQSYLDNKRQQLQELVLNQDFESEKVNKIFSVRERILDEILKNKNKIKHIGTIINTIEEFHHDLLIDIKRNKL